MKNNLLIISGLFAPVVFWGTTIVCGLMHDDYNHSVNMVSELGEVGTETQTMFTVGLTFTALLSVLFVIGLFRAARTVGLNPIPVVLILTFSISILGAAQFPYPLRLHEIFGSPSILLPLSPLLAWILWKPQTIKEIRIVSPLILAIMLLGFLVFIPDILNSNFGLKQRFFHIGWTAWFVYLAWRFLSLKSSRQQATSDTRYTMNDER